MKQETRARWAARVARWQASGLTAKEFAAQERLNAGTLSFWKWRLNQEAPPTTPTRPPRRQPKASRESAEALRFVEVLPTSPMAEATDAAFEVVVAGGRCCIRVPACFDEAALARLLAVVEAR